LEFGRNCARSSGRQFLKGYAEKKFRNIIQGGSGAFGNAATRMETFVAKGGGYAYGSYPDIAATRGSIYNLCADLAARIPQRPGAQD